jgi:hypothetical protein
MMTDAGAKVMIFSGANSGVMRSDLKSVDNMPSDEVLERRRLELNRTILAVRNNLLEVGSFPPDVAMMTDPNNPFSKVVQDWWASPLTTVEFAYYLWFCDLAVGGEGAWNNGFLGSRWADIFVNNLRVRVAFYTRSSDPKYFETLERQNIIPRGKHNTLFIFNTLYFQEDESHRTLIRPTAQEAKEWFEYMDNLIEKFPQTHIDKATAILNTIIGNTEQTVLIHDDEERFKRLKADLRDARFQSRYEEYEDSQRLISEMSRKERDARQEAEEIARKEDVARIEVLRKQEIARKAEEKKRHEDWLKSQEAETKRMAKEVEAKKKADALAKKTAEEEDRIKRMDEGQLKAFLKTIPARPAKTIRNGAGCVIDQTQKQKQWDEKWGQYKKYMK